MMDLQSICVLCRTDSSTDVLHCILEDFMVFPQNENALKALPSARKFTYFTLLQSFYWSCKASLRKIRSSLVDIVKTSWGKKVARNWVGNKEPSSTNSVYSAPVLMLRGKEKGVRGSNYLVCLVWVSTCTFITNNQRTFMSSGKKKVHTGLCSDLPWTLHDSVVHHTNILYIHM